MSEFNFDVLRPVPVPTGDEKALLLPSTSPSQKKEFGDCHRKWWLNKRRGIAQPTTLEQGKGQDCHSEMEAYIEDGVIPTHPSCLKLTQDPQFPEIIRSGVTGDARVFVEQPRNYNLGIKVAGIPMRGRIDLRIDYGKRIHIIDWKFVGSFGWELQPEQLAHDVQCIVYGEHAFTQNPAAEDVVFSHGYGLHSGAGAHIVSTDPLPREHFTAAFATLTPTVVAMKEVYRQNDIEKVEPNFRACKKFSSKTSPGCPYQDICSQTLGGHVLRAVPPPKTKPAPEPTESVTTPYISVRDRLAALTTSKTTSTSTSTPTAPSVVSTSTPRAVVAKPTTTVKVRAVGINPPDAAIPVRSTRVLTAEELSSSE